MPDQRPLGLGPARARLAAATTVEDRFANVATVVLFATLIVLIARGLGLVPWPAGWTLGTAAMVLLPIMVLRSRAGGRRRRESYAVDWWERADDRRTGTYAFGQDDGTEYIDRAHRFAYDLDVFGPGSLFECVNGCHTVLGRDKLAHLLRDPATTSGEIDRRQTAVAELRDALGERESLEIELRTLVDDSMADPQRLAEQTRSVIDWGEGPSPSGATNADRILCAVLPVLSIAGIVVWLALGWSWTIAAAPYALNIFFARRTRDLGTLMQVFETVRRTLDPWARTVETAAAFRFESHLLDDVIGALSDEHAPDAIRELRRVADRLSQRRNAFWAATGNVVLLSDVRARHALARWHREHGRSLAVWLRGVAELEAWCSLAGYAHGVPESSWPDVTDDGPVLAIEDMAHPLLSGDAVVPNSCRLEAPDAIWIVTGSNMSGKSTFLRTVGLGVVMTGLGLPVPATSMKLRPVRLATSMNVEDSLRDGTSRFHAEVKRLKRCLDWAAEGLTLVLLDEILGGTNSRERRIGTVSVLETLGELQSPTLVSTHDLGLADVADGWSREHRVVHFTDRVVDGRMTFDYRLREGRLPSTNALEVLRAEGIAVPTDPGSED